MNQSELETNTSKRRQTRENAWERVRELVLVDGFPLVEKVARVLLTNHKAQ